MALAFVLGLLALVCGGIVPSAFLWELVDAEDHFRAQMLFLAAAITAVVGMFLLEAFLLVMRFGVFGKVKGIVGKVYSILLVLTRVVCALGNAALLIGGVAGIVLSGAEYVGCVFTLLLLAVMVGGYALIFLLEKRLKTQA